MAGSGALPDEGCPMEIDDVEDAAGLLEGGSGAPSGGHILFPAVPTVPSLHTTILVVMLH